jgi:sec-independent protein translocase protein TatA
MGSLSPTHWLIVVVVVAALFGAKRLPDAARGLGRSLRILKAEIGTTTDQPPGPAERVVRAEPAVPAESGSPGRWRTGHDERAEESR